MNVRGKIVFFHKTLKKGTIVVKFEIFAMMAKKDQLHSIAFLHITVNEVSRE